MDAKPALVRPRLANDIETYVALWTTRLSIKLSAAFNQLNENFYSDDLRVMIGLTPKDGKLNRTETRALLNTRVEELAARIPHQPIRLRRNVAMLGELLGFDEAQREIITFVAIMQEHPFRNARPLARIGQSLMQWGFKVVVVCGGVSQLVAVHCAKSVPRKEKRVSVLSLTRCFYWCC